MALIPRAYNVTVEPYLDCDGGRGFAFYYECGEPYGYYVYAADTKAEVRKAADVLFGKGVKITFKTENEQG